MKREILITSDGSHTIAVPERNVTYHSRHGAIQESAHVFIQAGLYYGWELFRNRPLHVFEMGFGTGLNALLTAIEAQKQERKIVYTAIETDSLTEGEVQELNYHHFLGYKELFDTLHQSKWNTEVDIGDYFALRKEPADLLSYAAPRLFHLIYYDAFAPAAQPELWIKAAFEKLYRMLHQGGVLVTYCAKGDVRRTMQAVGFSVEKLPGPPHKREMLRAKKV